MHEAEKKIGKVMQSHVKEHTCFTALEARPYTVNSCCKSVCFCKEPHTVLFIKSPQKSSCYQTEGTQTNSLYSEGNQVAL